MGGKITLMDWGAESRPALQAYAASPSINDLTIRIWCAAKGYANLAGHAEFPVGELRRKITPLGEDPPSKHAVSRAISRAKMVGFITSDSSARCLRPTEWQNGGALPDHDRTIWGCRWHGLTNRKPRREDTMEEL